MQMTQLLTETKQSTARCHVMTTRSVTKNAQPPIKYFQYAHNYVHAQSEGWFMVTDETCLPGPIRFRSNYRHPSYSDRDPVRQGGSLQAGRSSTRPVVCDDTQTASRRAGSPLTPSPHLGYNSYIDRWRSGKLFNHRQYD